MSETRATATAANDRQLALLLACFDGRKAAAKMRSGLEGRLRAQGDEPLDTVVLEVDEKQKASVRDPRRIVWGTVTVTIVWGLCGLAGAYGAWSVLLWGAIGAIGGFLFLYYTLHHLTKSELAAIGSALPPQSSALATWVGTKDGHRLLEAVEVDKPTEASVALIGPDLTTQVLARATDPVELPARSADDPGGAVRVLSMVMLRYRGREAAQELALKPPADSVLEVELMIRGDADGSRHVSDPYFGVKAMAKSDALWWGGFGLVFGALAGALGGGGVLGFVEDGLLTAIVWGIVGLGVGVLYGFVFGKAVSARRLKSVGSLVAPGTSILMAWVDAKSPLTQSALDAYSRPGSQRLILNVNSTKRGAVLGATEAG